MSPPKFKIEIIEDHASADFVFDAYGQTLPDLFEACAIATFGAITDLERVELLHENKFELLGDDVNELLFGFISELIYLKDVERTFYCEFKIAISNDNKSLSAIVKGDRINYDKHIIKTDVKAVTYHNLNITFDKTYFKTRMILDL